MRAAVLHSAYEDVNGGNEVEVHGVDVVLDLREEPRLEEGEQDAESEPAEADHLHAGQHELSTEQCWRDQC